MLRRYILLLLLAVVGSSAHDFGVATWTPAKIRDIDDDSAGRSYRLYLYRR
ncbi:MAG: hypothetical protein M3N41_08765 [Acidobacteriota bacterium]|nr:hypothetical protein [Acidobacteriota bacterium]